MPLFKDIRLLNPPPSSWRSDPEFLIRIKYGSATKSTRRSAVKKGDADGDCVVWNQPITFAGEIADDSILTFTAIRAHHLIRKTIDSTSQRVVDLLKGDSGSCKLDFAGKCYLMFRIERLSDVIPEVVDEASSASAGLQRLKVAAETSDVITSAVQFYNDQEGTWSSFLLQFQEFMKVIDDVSEISPYVKIAWSILSVIPKTIITQKNRDDKVKQLCEKLKDIYDYVTDAKRLPELTTTQSKTLSVLVQQTIECAYFIREYSAENTVKIIVKGASMDDKIQMFNDKFDHLKQVMTDSVSLETSIITLRVAEKISELNDLTLLGELPYDSEAGFIPGKRCYPGTRQRLISEMLEWVNNETSPQILLLSGQAGTGKSSVAHTIAGLFRGQNRLGSMFCFNRSYKDRRNYLFSNISRDLADGDGMWRKELVEAVKKTADRKSKDPQIQFDELIIKPSRNVSTIGSVIIVIDALDESGERRERKEILGLLLDRCSELPKNYRIIVTSRPEQDIELQCQNSRVLCIRMGDINVEETHSDIQTYVSGFLAPISPTLDKIDRNWCKILAKRAEGLFQWARTACEFIDPNVIRPQLVEKKWKSISDSSSSLYGLYHQIISSQSESEDIDFIEDFKTIVGAIITAREPLSINALQYIFSSIGDIKTILSPFGSLFVGVHDSFTPVRPLHTSLFDFFTAAKNTYWIDTSDQSVMAMACLKLMNQMLCFNICKLETSHLRNRDMPNIDSCVKEAIPLHLSYSCRFWAFHLKSSHPGEDLLREIRKLMDYSLLYWFEVLSLLRTVDEGCVAMRKLADWCTDVDKGLAADALDALDFGYEFGDVITESTPHLYLSALPFTPRDSFISRTYLAAYPGLFTFDIGPPIHSSRKIYITRKHTHGHPTSVAFHPKSKYIATGSGFGELWIWDHTTGESVHKYNHRSDASISEIVFSSDGELVYCCFENGDILVWSVRTDEMREESYAGLIDDWSVLCTISSDGCFTAFQKKHESSLLLYDRTNHLTLKQIDNPMNISGITFSPDGNLLAFRMGREVHVWNTRQARDILQLGQATSVALSDNCVALGRFGVIEIWDVLTSTKFIEIRHGTRVEQLQFAPDNQYIISSSDKTYSIWNMSAGDLISQSSMDANIRCLAFSHDSKFLVLGAEDGTVNVRQWDISVHPGSHAFDDGSQDVWSDTWLQNKYFIIRYSDLWGMEGHLQISDVTSMNTILFQAELEGRSSPITVSPDKERAHVAYVTSRGLCLWDETRGEVILDESGRQITALASSSKYIVSADISNGGRDGTIRTWDVYTGGLIGGPYAISDRVEKLIVPEGSTHFIVAYGDRVDVREHGSGRIIGGPFKSEPISNSSVVALSPNQTHVTSIQRKGAEIIDVTTGARAYWVPYVNNSMPRLSPNGKYLAWVVDDGGVKLLDTDSAMPLETLFLGRHVHGLGFSNNSKQIVIISSSSAGDPEMTTIAHLNVWDIPSEQITIKSLLFEIRLGYEIRNLALSNGYLLFNYDLAMVWDMDAYEMSSVLYDTHQNNPQLVNIPEVKWSIENTSGSTKTEALDYALMAWKKASIPAFARPQYDGWVLGLNGELLLWVPKERRGGFWTPCATHVPYRNVTKLNFNNFVHGTRWSECRQNAGM